jgi:16S rRNA (cytosine1402-N4)-methyltransferase
MKQEHVPVLLSEVIEGLNIRPGKVYVDLTLGRGGHSKEIIAKMKMGILIAIDQDEEAITKSKEVLKSDNVKIITKKSNFVYFKDALKELRIDKVDGVLMDLGVSSPQFDDISRGFSYKEDAELDMRMDRSQELTAKEIVNSYSLDELCKIFREYGDERYAYPIAKNILKSRPINTTSELVAIVKKSKPFRELLKIGHPAKQIFQALRIATNDELNILTKTLSQAVEALNHKGRLAVITFHSGEDKIVKDFFNKLTKVVGNRLNIPDEERKIEYRLVNQHPIAPTNGEIESNHRAKSAKLRIIERI